MISSEMFKNRNRTYLVFLLLLIGTCSFVFAVDFSQTLDLAKQDIFSMGDLFKGKSTVSNLYGKALKLAKDKEVVSTTTSFDQLKAYFNNCSRVTDQDFINILYHTNFSFKNTFDLILPKGTKKPSAKDIDASYSKFFTCKGIKIPTSTDVQNITDEITSVYYAGYTATYAVSTLNEDNYGSDFFWNGTLDDSDFDILYDINQVGKTFFENFKDSPQVLFYSMPQVKAPVAQSGTPLSSLTDQSSYQVGGGGGSFPATVSTSPGASLVGGSNVTTTTTTTSVSQSIITHQQISSVTDDQEVQSFIENTNATAPALPAGAALVFGNQCLSGETATPAVEAPPVLMTPEEYISGIVTFIDNANINDVITTNLLTQFHQNNPLPAGASTSDSGYANGVANVYAEQAFGAAVPGSCESTCTSLPLDKQAQCELSCSKSCIQKCDGLGIQDKALCVSDCVCFLIAGPNGAGWKGVEDMYRIKFCKVPAQQVVLHPGKTVYSIQAIFQEISDVLAGLRDSGQMVKFSKTKEFLDSNIKIKFADNFAFKLEVGFKPLFEQKSAIIKRQEQAQLNTDLNAAVLGMNVTAPEADDYNKYIVISKPSENKANLEPATSLAEINQNIAKFQSAAAAADVTQLSNDKLDAVVTAYGQQTSILFIQNMISFLKDNQSFWDTTALALLDMNKMTLELKSKIENSK